MTTTNREQGLEVLLARIELAARFIEWLDIPDDGSALYASNPPVVLREVAQVAKSLARELDELQDGRRAVLPQTKEHALNLYTVAVACLKSHGVDPEAIALRSTDKQP